MFCAEARPVSGPCDCRCATIISAVISRWLWSGSRWLAGGGVKPGISYGKTDDYSYNIVENPVEVHDLHATMLNQLGINHERLAYRHQGRDYRLTDVHGKVVKDILA